MTNEKYANKQYNYWKSSDWHQILINEEDQEVKEFLINEFRNVLASSKIQEAILGNLFYETQDKRFAMIMDKINKVANS